MRGRWQAAVVACLGSFVPIVSPAAVGLVGLRHGLSAVVQVAPWALLPSLAMLASGGADSLLTMASIAVVIVVVVAAEVLRRSASWASAAIAVTVAGLASAVVLSAVGAEQLAATTALLAEMLAEVATEQAPLPIAATPLFVAGLFGWIVAVGALVALLVSRWWQALLYNPGGFGSEFRQTRMNSAGAIALAVVVLAGWLQGADYRPWAELLSLPLLLAGLALLHHIAAVRGLGTIWLGMIYVGLVIFSPLNMVIIGLAVADSTINIRSRIAAR